MKHDNIVWNFFSSVKLALFTLGCLSITSIFGTLIPQKESFDYYVQKYGVETANFLQLFDLTNMYTAWWFLLLLGLLSANLIVCSIERFPVVWRQIHKDNLDIPIEKLKKLGIEKTIQSPLDANSLKDKIPAFLQSKGWKIESRNLEDYIVFFSQRFKYSRTGVYIVHLSILVIFAGAIYGQLTGFRGGLMLPELQSSNMVYPYSDEKPIPLPFEVKCERFDIDFYDNGAPKLYRSKLTLSKDGKILTQTDIEVNKPLTYKGITFYQASYKTFRDFVFSISINEGEPVTFMGEFQKEIQWKENSASFGIINLETIRERVTRIKIWFQDGDNDPTQFWMDSADTVEFQSGDKKYTFSAKQMYATGLQVAKDPGVWVVYVGFGLMLLGLYMAFFMSHQRIWVILQPQSDTAEIVLRGTVNKNKVGFQNQFDDLAQSLRDTIKS